MEVSLGIDHLMRDAVGPLLGQECNGMCLAAAGCRAAAALDVHTRVHRDVCVEVVRRMTHGMEKDPSNKSPPSCLYCCFGSASALAEETLDPSQMI